MRTSFQMAQRAASVQGMVTPVAAASAPENGVEATSGGDATDGRDLSIDRINAKRQLEALLADFHGKYEVLPSQDMLDALETELRNLTELTLDEKGIGLEPMHKSCNDKQKDNAIGR